MANIIRYPWASLAVGDRAIVHCPGTRQSVHNSLTHFREMCRRLGYTDACMPRFELTWGQDKLLIDRVSDGPLRRHQEAARVALVSAHDMERQAVVDAMDAWIHRNVIAMQRGESRRMFPLDLVERARAVDPELAQRMADMDTACLDDYPGRRATDRQAANPDLPKDEALCRRLAACSTSTRV